MKKIVSIVIVLIITLLNCIGQTRQINYIDNFGTNDITDFSSFNSGGNKWFNQFIIPIEKNGVSIDNGISVNITGLSNLSTYEFRLQEQTSLPGIYFIDTTLTVNNGTANINLTFNGSDISTVYRIIIWDETTGSEVNFQTNVNGSLVNTEYYIVTERSKTGTFAGTTFNYKINWVDYWLNNHANSVQFLEDAEAA